jgi:hypothetical protein
MIITDDVMQHALRVERKRHPDASERERRALIHQRLAADPGRYSPKPNAEELQHRLDAAGRVPMVAGMHEVEWNFERGRHDDSWTDLQILNLVLSNIATDPQYYSSTRRAAILAEEAGDEPDEEHDSCANCRHAHVSLADEDRRICAHEDQIGRHTYQHDLCGHWQMIPRAGLRKAR